MRVCFVGIGSIARRHILNLMSIAADEGLDITIDCVRQDKYKELPDGIKGFISNIYGYKDELLCNYNIMFITNPTNMHYETLMRYADNAHFFFIEKPVFTSDNVVITNKSLNRRIYVACPLRYNSIIKYLKENVCISNVRSVRCICSSYLPEWRPDIDYRDNYSAYRDMGGGVKCDLIHEWDYLQYLFGIPQKMYVIDGKKSNLEIDSEDIAVYIAEYTNMIMELHLDYFGRVKRRELEIITDDDTIIADLILKEIRFLNDGKVIVFTDNRDDYQKEELKTVLSIIAGMSENKNDLDRALNTLRLAYGKI